MEEEEGGKGGGGYLCVCDHPRQRGSGKGLFMMSVIEATRRLRASIQ